MEINFVVVAGLDFVHIEMGKQSEWLPIHRGRKRAPQF